MSRLPDASNSDYNDLPIHATKTYHQLHESYLKDKFKNNDQSYQHYTNLHKKAEHPTQKQQTTLRQLHETYTTTKKQLLKLPTKKQHNNLTIFASAESDEDSYDSFVNWCIGIICNSSNQNGRRHPSLLNPVRGR